MRETPTAEECYELWDTYHVPVNVRGHLSKVRDVSILLGQELQKAGQTVDLALTEAGALLHDVLRFVGVPQVNLRYFEEPPTMDDFEEWRRLDSKYSGLNHAQAAGAELRELGYSEALALVVERHDYAKVIDPEERPSTWEEKIVFYADKRVLHRELVSLDRRFDDGAVRYPEFINVPGEELKRAGIYELERVIFSQVSFTSEGMDQKLTGSS